MAWTKSPFLFPNAYDVRQSNFIWSLIKLEDTWWLPVRSSSHRPGIFFLNRMTNLSMWDWMWFYIHVTHNHTMHISFPGFNWNVGGLICSASRCRNIGSGGYIKLITNIIMYMQMWLYQDSGWCQAIGYLSEKDCVSSSVCLGKVCMVYSIIHRIQ